MAKARYGNFEYGDVYFQDEETGGRGEFQGRLIVDQDNDRFFIRSKNKAASAIPQERVLYFLANNLIDFDQEDYRDMLASYLKKIIEYSQNVREKQRKDYQKEKTAQKLRENTKLIKKTKFRARMAKIFWSIGCLAIVGLGLILARPMPEPLPAVQSIAGEGMEYPVDNSLLADATYITAIGNGQELYGIIMDDIIVESGQQNSNESTIKENVLINAGVSQTYPIHMRPLYYSKASFYQSQMKLNDADQGSSGIVLQNPNGYATTHAMNEIVLFGGKGMSSVALSSPAPYVATSAKDTASVIEQEQQRAAQELLRGSASAQKTADKLSVEMPAGWIGYDYADIDKDIVVGSYWYTKNSTLDPRDLKRRVAVWNITPVLNTGADGVSSMECMQINWQDVDSNFYNPIVSLSPSSNGSRYWIGYTKQDVLGNTGFFIRKYDTARDVLLESYDNTWSTKDLTGSEFPITNYTLNGDRLFFEQQGYIWVMDLSKTSITVQGNQRTVKKENPIKICKSSEIRPSVTRDEQFIAQENGATTVPISHYQVVTMTTAGGVVEYGIAFIEASSGNLVFQPVNGAAVAAAQKNTGSGDNSVNNVYSGDQAALDKAKAEEEARNSNKSSNKNNSSNSSANNNTNTSANTNSSLTQNQQGQTQNNGAVNPSQGNTVQNGIQNGIQQNGVQNQTTQQQNPGVPIAQSAYTLTGGSDYSLSQSAETSSVNNGRILIKAGSTDVQIICFCVRGEQFFWLEQATADNSRRIMVSPIYYKNDASQIESAKFSTTGDGENTEEVQGVQSDPQQQQPSQSTTPDVVINNTNNTPANPMQNTTTPNGVVPGADQIVQQPPQTTPQTTTTPQAQPAP